MNPLIKFENNNKIYCVELNNKELRYFYIKDNKKIYNLSLKEKELIDYVLDSVTPSNNFIKIMNYKLNNKEYKVYLDNNTNLKIFKPIPNHNDSIILNKIFNNMEEYVASIKKPKGSLPIRDDTPYFKRIIKYGTKFMVVNVSSILATIMLVSVIASPAPAYKARDFIQNLTYNDIAYTSNISNEELLLRFSQAIESNSNLTDEEKEYFLTLKYAILDNKQYINIYYIEDVLKSLRIEYHQEKSKSFEGLYNPTTNTIVFNGSSCFKDVELSTISHEFFHSITERKLLSNNTFLTETINTIFNEEYSHVQDDNLYKNYTKYTYSLMEIIGSEPLKRYHGYEDIDYIITPLCQIINDRSKAKKLLELMDDYKRIFDAFRYEEINETEGLENLKNIDIMIKQELGEYYQKKYGIQMEQDLIMLSYLDKSAFGEVYQENYLKNNPDFSQIDFNEKNYKIIIMPNNKRYFSTQDSISEMQVYTVIYDEENNKIFESIDSINDSNRYLLFKNVQTL